MNYDVARARKTNRDGREVVMTGGSRGICEYVNMCVK